MKNNLHIIGGKYKYKALVAPKSNTRPTLSMVRESLFNICQHSIQEALFLDLFAGAGAIGLEALSRGAQHVTFVENNRQAIAAIKANIASLGVESQTTLLVMDVMHALALLVKNKASFDLIFADPPYQMGEGEKVLQFIDEHPMLLKPQAELFVEEGASLHLPLKTLHLVNERKLGRAFLHLFRTQ